MNGQQNTTPEAGGKRGAFLATMAVLIAVLAFSNFTKPLQNMRNPAKGLVVFGYRFATVGSNAVVGPLFGLILAAYAYGLWTMKRWVLPLSMAYAFYVPANLMLFWFRYLGPRPSPGFIVFYLAVALTGSLGTALYLAYHHRRLD